MPDLATIATALSSLKTATEIAKYISNSGASLEKAEVKLKFAELVGALADAKLEIADIQSMLIEKDEEIRNLNQVIERKENVLFENRVYWTEINGERDGPYCQRCYDADSTLIRLQPNSSTIRGNTSRWLNCTVCKTNFDT